MRILIVDDERMARLNIKKQLQHIHCEISEAQGLEEAVSFFELQSFDLCFIDLNLDNSKELSGLELIPIAVNKGVYTVVMTSISSDAVAMRACELGCNEVYLKGNEKSSVAEVINNYLFSKDHFDEQYLIDEVAMTQNKRYKESLKELVRVSSSNVSICIHGESGTGKSHIARAIHKISKRKGNFVEVNCASFSGDTLMSELFGYGKGAFTGANADKQGKLCHANDGTLFLDEIGSMSLPMQEALLKAIEEKAYYPVGSNKLVKSDFKIICATLDNLEALIRAGKFRFDLYSRLVGFTFTVPSLRNRKEDILPLIRNNLKQEKKIVFKESAKTELENYEWPGNIRELLKFCNMATLPGSGSMVTEENVKKFVRESSFKNERPLLDDHHVRLAKEMGMETFMKMLKVKLIEMVHEECGESPVKVIDFLKISPGTYYRNKTMEPVFQ